ncbi:MAG: DUF2868 domain-containing protein [Akkermansiaceae bacterium]|nr:DUF2868 domain-containing protein [Akkermansiaceae bacterium]
MKRWLSGRSGGVGSRWVGAMRLAGLAAVGLAAAAGCGVVWGALDAGQEPAGLRVLWVLGGLWVLPWFLFFLGAILWLLRGRLAGGGFLSWALRHLAERALPREGREVMAGLAARGELARALGWRLAGWTQGVAAAFHAGGILGLGAMVLFKRVGFFWETTTRGLVREGLETAVAGLSAPWGWVWPWAVPDVAGSELGADWAEAGLGWWPFLMLVLAVWGIFPRLLLVAVAKWRERRVLAELGFDGPEARRLHRVLTQVKRGEEPSGPADGALVVALGAEPEREALRTFLLQRLRMNPSGWESMGVMDEGREERAREALAKAPAGIVLVAEAWALAPRQMEKALADVARRGQGRRLALVVTGQATAEQKREWEKFVDAGKAAGPWELWFHENS